VAARRLSQTAVTCANTTTGDDVTWDDGSTSLTLISGVTYDIVTTVTLAVKAAVGQTISLAPYINGAANIGSFLATATNTDFVTITNSHTLAVVGTGAAISCSARVKVNGGTGQYLTGTQLVTATPRR
jgi:2C-methyl-D-erythritol 2,4-cyclodiphosphate synthase